METTCIPTHTRQWKRTSPPQMHPGWTPGCSAKSKYVVEVLMITMNFRINVLTLSTGLLTKTHFVNNLVGFTMTIFAHFK